MVVLGTNISGNDVVHVVPAFFGLLAAALRVLPNAVTSARGHGHGPAPSATAQTRVTAYLAPRPFSETFPRRYEISFTDRETAAARKAMRARTLSGCLASAIAVAALTVAYVWYGATRHNFPAWSLIVALAVGTAVFVALVYVYASVRGDASRGSAAPTQWGRVVLTGSEQDVRQHCLAALRDLGARLVSMNGSRILAATGISFGRDMFMGEVIWVRIASEEQGVRVEISSTKADFISRSRSRRNVTKFLESWATFPDAPFVSQGAAGLT